MTRNVTAEDLGSGIVHLQLNLPKMHNALTAHLREDLVEALDNASEDKGVRGVILSGRGGNFCSGGDITTMGELTEISARDRMDGVKASAMSIATFPKPLVSLVNGHAAGAGVGLALLADVVVATSDATFTFSFRELALGPDWGLSHTLKLRVGGSKARQLLMLGAAVSGEEAHAMGLVDEVCPAWDDAVSAANGVLSRLVAEPHLSRIPIKVQMSDLDGLSCALDAETEAQVQRFLSSEHRAAVSKFHESRARRKAYA